MAAPIAYAVLLMGALGLLVFLIWLGSTADGARVRVSIESQCLSKSASLIEDRADEIGLAELSSKEEGTLLILDAILPDLENAQADIPNLLVQTGNLSFQDGETVLAKDVVVKDASIALGESGMPYAAVVLETETRQKLQKHILKNPKGFVSIYLDGKKIIERPNTNKLSDTELRLISSVGGMRAQMKQTADWAIVLKHGPLPCSHKIKSIAPL